MAIKMIIEKWRVFRKENNNKKGKNGCVQPFHGLLGSAAALALPVFLPNSDGTYQVGHSTFFWQPRRLFFIRVPALLPLAPPVTGPAALAPCSSGRVQTTLTCLILVTSMHTNLQCEPSGEPSVPPGRIISGVFMHTQNISKDGSGRRV